MSWPYIEGDFMEIGNSGWVSVGEGRFININTGHSIDKNGNEYDEDGIMVAEHRPEED